MRARTLRRDVLCRVCRLARSTIADHVIPHKGDRARFFDPGNLQGVCKRCHDSVVRRDEGHTLGSLRGSDISGLPNDPDHAWHRTKA